MFWLGVTLKELIELIHLFQQEGICFCSLKENFDISTCQGAQLLNVMEACYEMDRNIIIDRTKDGLEKAKLGGRFGGRPELHDESKKALGYEVFLMKEKPVGVIASELGMSRATLYRYIEKKQK